MKFDMTRPLSRSAQRVVSAMSEALFLLLCRKRFEEVSVSEICDASGYPRATFYNYFEDKYDLLNMIWVYIEQILRAEDGESYSTAESFDVHFDRLYDMLASGEERLKDLLAHNKSDGYFVASLVIYLKKSIKKLLLARKAEEFTPIPIDMLTAHYANTLLLVFGYRFGGQSERITKEETKEYLIHLIKGPMNIPLSSGK